VDRQDLAMTRRSRNTTRYLGTITRTQLDNAARPNARPNLTVVPDNDYLLATALIHDQKGATRWTGVVDQQTGRFAYMAPTGTDEWQPTVLTAGQYTGLELADGAA
jgi:hypothetical protein